MQDGIFTDISITDYHANKTHYSATQLKMAAHEAGVTFLRDSAEEKLEAGITTLKEINRVTFVE